MKQGMESVAMVNVVKANDTVETAVQTAVQTLVAPLRPAKDSVETVWTVNQSYHELSEVPVREIDLIETLEANLAHIEDLQARLRFMVREVKYLLKV